jgi:hypothetical protein
MALDGRTRFAETKLPGLKRGRMRFATARRRARRTTTTARVNPSPERSPASRTSATGQAVNACRFGCPVGCCKLSSHTIDDPLWAAEMTLEGRARFAETDLVGSQTRPNAIRQQPARGPQQHAVRVSPAEAATVDSPGKRANDCVRSRAAGCGRCPAGQPNQRARAARNTRSAIRDVFRLRPQDIAAYQWPVNAREHGDRRRARCAADRRTPAVAVCFKPVVG